MGLAERNIKALCRNYKIILTTHPSTTYGIEIFNNKKNVKVVFCFN